MVKIVIAFACLFALCQLAAAANTEVEVAPANTDIECAQVCAYCI